MSDAKSPGWYPAPDGKGDQWWNGVSWSESRRGTQPAVPAAAASALSTPAPAPEMTQQPRVVYSASNPAPQTPGAPTLQGLTLPPAALTINARANPQAIYGLIAGIFAVVFNVLLIPSILAIYFSIRGLAKARELSAGGIAGTLRSPALIGLILGIVGAVSGLAQAIFFIGSIVSSIFVSVSA